MPSSPREEILVYLSLFLREPALAKIASFEDEVFAGASQSLEIIGLDMPGQVQRYCDRLSFWKRLIASDLEEMVDRKTSVARTMMYGHLFRSLLGRQLDSIPMANLFAGTGPNVASILSSVDPEVMKLREHLGVAMVIFELVEKHACLPIKQAWEGRSKDTLENPKEMSDRLVLEHNARLDLVGELFDFRRSATDWQQA